MACGVHGIVIRVAILSDTHGYLDPRIAQVAADCDYAVHAGDIGGRAVAEALRPGRAALFVRGNNDVASKWPRCERAWLESIPWEAELTLPGGRLVVVHGHRAGAPAGRHERLRREYPEARLLAYGHSHRQCVDRSARPWIVNPGAAGRARTFGGPSYVLLIASERHWRLLPKRLAPLPRGRRARFAGA